MSVGSLPHFFLATSLVIVLFGNDVSGSTFTWDYIRGGCIRGHNEKVVSVTSSDQCKALCVQEASFVCRSAEYNKRSRRCSLSKAWSGNVLVEASCYVDGYDLYERVPAKSPVSTPRPTPPPTPPPSKYTWVEKRGGCIKGNNNKITSAPNLEACKRLCDQERGFACRSVDYKADRRQCLLSVKWSGTIKVSLPCYIKGYTYAEKVPSSPPTPRFSWVERRGGCIKGNNNKITSAPNLEACKQQCDQERGFACRSVDYKANSRQCLLSVKWSGTIKVSLPCYIKGYTYAEKVPSSPGSDRTTPRPSTPRFSWVDKRGGCIKGNNNKITSASNLEACKQKCDQERGFPCRSVDYRTSSRQCLMSVKWSGTIKVSLPCYIKGYTYAEKVPRRQ